MPDGKTVFVSGTPDGVLGAVMAVLSGGLRGRFDHRLQGWQAFGLLLIWKRFVLCLRAKHVLRSGESQTNVFRYFLRWLLGAFV